MPSCQPRWGEVLLNLLCEMTKTSKNEARKPYLRDVTFTNNNDEEEVDHGFVNISYTNMETVEVVNRGGRRQDSAGPQCSYCQKKKLKL